MDCGLVLGKLGLQIGFETLTVMFRKVHWSCDVEVM